MLVITIVYTQGQRVFKNLVIVRIFAVHESAHFALDDPSFSPSPFFIYTRFYRGLSPHALPSPIPPPSWSLLYMCVWVVWLCVCVCWCLRMRIGPLRCVVKFGRKERETPYMTKAFCKGQNQDSSCTKATKFIRIGLQHNSNPEGSAVPACKC